MLDRIISSFESIPKVAGHFDIYVLERQIQRQFDYFEGSKKLYVYLPHWGDGLGYLKNLRKVILERKQSINAYGFPRKVLSSDWRLTLDCFETLRANVQADILRLKNKYGFSEIIVLANSLGCVHACMFANRDPIINKLYLLTPGHDLAESMWHGLRTQFLRREFENRGTDLMQLKKHWHDLAPENNLNLKGVETHIYLSRSDQIIPYRFGAQLVENMQRLEIGRAH